MKNSATIVSLKAMRFGTMAAELERQMQDPATYAHMGFEERVALLVDAEWNSRQNNKLLRCIREPGLRKPLPLLKILNTMKTDIWTRPSSYGLPPVISLPKEPHCFQGSIRQR